MNPKTKKYLYEKLWNDSAPPGFRGQDKRERAYWSVHKIGLLVLIHLFVTGTLLSQSSNKASAIFSPEGDETLLILGQDLGSVAGYADSGLFPSPGGVTQYTDLYELGGLNTINNYGAGDICLQCAIDTYPNSTLAIGLWMVEDNDGVGNDFPNGLTDIVNGVFDNSLQNLADFFNSNASTPIYLRIGYEFDGPWNHYEPAKYIAAYQYIVDYLRNANVANVAYVWQSATWGETYNNNPISAWYPGDSYVDYVGLSFFFYDENFNGPNLSTLLQIARNANKPVMMAEVSAQYYELDQLTFHWVNDGPSLNGIQMMAEEIWNQFFRDQLFNFINENDDVIRIVAYINADWQSQPQWTYPDAGSGFWGDTRLEVNSYISTQWNNEVDNANWLHGSATLFDNLIGGNSSNTCNNGVQDGDETDIDCGGSCIACEDPPTCSDNIQNGNETGVDCGGDCAPCNGGNSSETIQAESGVIIGSASIYNDGAATGGQGVAYISSQGAGFRLENVPATTEIEIKYASELSGAMSLFVDGQDIGNVNFSSTGSWVGNYQTVSHSTTISGGSDFEVIFQNGDVAFNVDEVTFNYTSTGGPSCSDGIQNQDETGVDCGGSCAPCPPESYDLIVNNGNGSGTYQEGTTVNISWVEPVVDPGTAIEFSGWTGDAQYLSDASAASTSVTMPNQDVTVSANYVVLNSCSDGVQNGDETGVDCGGQCAQCPLDSYNLTVNNGTGGGTYEEGSTVTISWTEPIVDDGTGIVFSGWTGDTQYLADPGATTTSVVMPDQDVEVTGNYTVVYSCTDGIQNGDETGVDCGGDCAACPPGGNSSETIQAETGVIIGSASVYNDSGATGGQGVAYISSPGAGFRLENVPAATEVEIKYASELSGEMSLFVNSQDIGNVSFSSTGSWVGNYQTISYVATISAGSDFEIVFQNGDAAFNVDEVTFIYISSDPSCSDGIQNQDETGVDCGGSCTPCPPETYTLTVNNGTGSGSYEENSTVAISWTAPSVDPGTGIEFSGWSGDTQYLTDASLENTTVTMPGQDISVTGNYTTIYSCSDGVQNGNETDTDCGGDCTACGVDPVTVVSSTSIDGDYILTGGVDSDRPGFTLYTWDNDGSGPFSNCEDGCTDSWPPLLVPSASAVLIPSDLPAEFDGSFGVSGRCDGTYQLTYDNMPLYFFINDNAPGDTNGDQPTGTWHMVAISTTPEPTCSDGIMNGDEAGIDCGGSCPNSCVGPGEGMCEGYGLAYTGGSTGIIYSHESLGAPCYMCTGPGFNGCTPNFTYSNGFYQLEVSVTAGSDYSFGIQCGPNVLVEGTVGEGTNCWITPSCNDGYLNGNETGVDCGGPDCGACPTCDDGIMNGDETGIDCGGSLCTGDNADCATVCNGTPNPFATFEHVNETFEGLHDGSITFSFVNVADRNTLEFSLDGGISYPYSSPDNAGSFDISNLAPDTYSTYIRWSGGDCPMYLGNIVISVGQPQPTCSDGLLNQGEEGVDCGGPCTECTPDPCGSIPLVTYPKPALPTAIIGADPGQGFAIDLSLDLTSVDIRAGAVVGGQSGDNPRFEFFCSCNQVQFYGTSVTGPTSVPTECVNAGDYYYFVRYQKQGNTTDDPGDVYVYSALFTTSGTRIDPDNRPTITSSGANWMRFRHPHAQDGITEAVFDAHHNGDLLRYLDRFATEFTDAAGNLNINPRLTSSNGNFHPHGDVDNADPVRIDYMEIGSASPPVYAKGGGNEDAGKWGWGNIITYEITAVTGGSGAQTYNTFQNYVIGDGLNTFGDPRNASAGKATTNMVLPGFGSAKQIEHNAIFTQHIITLQTEDDVDDFLEGHHLFHAAQFRDETYYPDGTDPPLNVPGLFIGDNACGNCHFRDGRGSEVIQTPRGPRVPPAVIGTGLLEWMSGREAGFRWDGGVATVEEQTRNALVEDHGIDPDNENQISPQDLDRIVKYVEFLSVPARSYAAHDDGVVQTGNVKFVEVGCAGCHTMTQKTRNDAPEIFRGIVIRPYTDMKTHVVTDGRYRTPALWGLGRNIKLLEDNGRQLLLMHDGRATTLEAAIQAHGGEAAGSRDAFNALDESDRQAVIEFLKSL